MNLPDHVANNPSPLNRSIQQTLQRLGQSIQLGNLLHTDRCSDPLETLQFWLIFLPCMLRIPLRFLLLNGNRKASYGALKAVFPTVGMVEDLRRGKLYQVFVFCAKSA